MTITMKIDETSESSSGPEDDSSATSEAPPQIPLDPDDYGPFVPGLNVEDDYQRDVLQLVKDRQIEVYEYQVELWAVEFRFRSGYGLRSTTQMARINRQNPYGQKPTKADTNTPFDKEFPEVRIAMDKAHNMLSKAFLGEVSLKEARVSVREADKAMREARKKMVATRRRHKKID